LIKKAIVEIVFDIITIAVFGAAIVALMYISNKMQPHKHTDKCLIEEKTK
jgi:hypothetical protein